ncbi:hypothetical protein MMC08_005019 [Hypocenomyce scalaris]|nr:hypothetical protein [Hypocenomyce scalaris]
MPLELAEEWLAFEAAIGMRPKVEGKDIPELRENVRKSRMPLADSETLKINGGGFCFGDLDIEEGKAAQLVVLIMASFAELKGPGNIRFIAEAAPMVVVSVDYRLAPEHKWPTSRDDCITATKWALEHFTHDSNVDTSKLIICGGSAGGQLALATTSKLIGQGIPVHGVVALVPIAIGENAVPDHLKGKYISMKENADAPLIDYHLMSYLLNHNGHDDHDPEFSLLLSPSLQNFPSTYIVTCGADCLRDDGFLLADEMRKYGISVRHDNYPGYPHYFWGVPVLKASQTFRDNLSKGLHFVISGEE